MDSAWQWVAAFVAYDFCYYWKHRYGHEWRIMWASHIAHHQSEEFNLSTALRQTGTDYIGFVFYIPLYLVGIPAAAMITVGSLNLIYQFWVHTEHIRRVGPLEWMLVTPSNHRVHHARNPEYIDRNYGGVFIVWDRLFGTFKDERTDVPCVYGITTGLEELEPAVGEPALLERHRAARVAHAPLGRQVAHLVQAARLDSAGPGSAQEGRSQLSKVRSAGPRLCARLHLCAVLDTDVRIAVDVAGREDAAARLRPAACSAGCASRCSCKVPHSKGAHTRVGSNGCALASRWRWLWSRI